MSKVPFFTLENLDEIDPNPRDATLETMAVLLGCGLDPAKSIIFAQSSVSAHSELMWILNSMTPMSWLNKMT